MINNENSTFTLLILACFLFLSSQAFAESSKPETYEKQKVQKLEKDEGRYQQLKKDADPRGRTEENKGNFDSEVPRGDGVEYPPAKTPNKPN